MGYAEPKSEGGSKARKISLGDDFGAVVVTVNGATIEVSSDGVAKVQSAPPASLVVNHQEERQNMTAAAKSERGADWTIKKRLIERRGERPTTPRPTPPIVGAKRDVQGSGGRGDTAVIYAAGPLIVQKGYTRVEFNASGGIDVYGDVPVTLHPAADDDVRAKAAPEIGDKMEDGTVYAGTSPDTGPANDTAAKATTHEIGAIESAGEHKGEIYGGLYPADNKPIWFSAAPKLMDHYKAAAWAEGQGGSLPTRKQGDYLTTLKGKGGAFTEIFNRGSSFPAGYVWLAEPGTNYRSLAWCQRLSDGAQYYDTRFGELLVLSVRR